MIETTAEESTTETDTKVLDPMKDSEIKTDTLTSESESQQDKELNETEEGKPIQTISSLAVVESNEKESDRVCNDFQIVQNMNGKRYTIISITIYWRCS